ncbi:MAG TPA: isoamylase early set domain-containing protein [Kineosporiaceae bacterium]|nr:isoamylase early set domain-containing protein [Kineosporiaceae bacterium]
MIKTRLTGGSVLVTFELPAAAAAAAVSVCGEFNDWSPATHRLTRTDNGSFQATLELQAGRRWRFRYLLDGQRWENDWAADDYLPNVHGGDDSVVDLTDTSALTPVPAADAADRADIADPAAAADVPAEAGSATSATPRKSAAAEARTGRPSTPRKRSAPPVE